MRIDIAYIFLVIFVQNIVAENFSVNYVSWVNNPPYYIKGHRRIGMVPQTIKYHFPTYITNTDAKSYRFNYIDDPKYHLDTEKQLIELLDETNKTRLLQRLNTTENSSDIFIALATTKKTQKLFSPIPIIQRYKMAIVMRTSDLLLLNQFFIGIWNCKSIIYLAVAAAVNLAAVIWVLEIRTNSDFHQNFGAGLWTSFWYCCVTMTTVGYGDKVPKHFLSRSVCLLWMFFGVMFVAMITASVMESVQGESSKVNMKIGVSRSKIEASFVKNQLSANPIQYDTNEQIMDAVRNKEVDAGFLDSNIVAYIFKDQNIEDLKAESIKTLHKTVWAHIYHNQNITNLSFNFMDSHRAVPSETVLRVETLFVPNMQESHYYTRSFGRLFDREDGGLVFYMSLVAGFLVSIALLLEIRGKYYKYSSKEDKQENKSNNNPLFCKNCNWCFTKPKIREDEEYSLKHDDWKEERSL